MWNIGITEADIGGLVSAYVTKVGVENIFPYSFRFILREEGSYKLTDKRDLSTCI